MYSELLDPNVRWGPADDPESGCHNRSEVLGWYRRGRAKGVRAKVTEVLVGGEKIMVGMTITGNAAAQSVGIVSRWQILTVANGRIVDIRGFDNRDEALHRLG